jgi:hypothetical protein
MNSIGILSNIDNPGQLEKLYRDNKSAFKSEFNSLYPELTDNKLATFWHERLKYESSEINWGSTKELAFVLIAAFIGGIIAQLPLILDIDRDVFYPRNIGFIIFPILTTYFIWKTNLSGKKTALVFLVTLVSLFYINLFPEIKNSDTFLLSCIHLPLFLWAVLGFTYTGNNTWSYPKRLEFLRYNGDLLIMSGLILIAGGMLTAITIGLFSAIGIHIENFYVEYVVVFCLPAIPILGTFITQTNPQLVNKVSPVIAKIFSPLVLVTLVVYLGAILYSGKNPYQDREFLMLFNLLLIGVMAIILFSIAEAHKKSENRAGSFILLALSLVTIIVNGIALSAILFRISEWGITPNRLAVLGGNILMLINLCMVAFRLFRHVSNKTEGMEVGNSIAMFLPVYCLWTVLVTFLFPFLFHFN